MTTVQGKQGEKKVSMSVLPRLAWLFLVGVLSAVLVGAAPVEQVTM